MSRAATAFARRSLAAQLAVMDANPDWMTPDAREALLTEAKGSSERLRILLATTLFLAETEDAPRIDLELAQRAGALQPQREEIAVLSHKPRRSWQPALRGLGAVALCLCSGLAGMALDQRLHPLSRVAGVPATSAPAGGALACAPGATAAVPAPHTATALPTAAAQTTSVAGAPAAPPVQTAPAAAAPPAIAAPPQAVGPSVTAPPDSPQAPPAPAPAAIPVAQVRFFLSSPGSAPKARFVEQRLAASGFIVRTVPDLGLRGPRHAAVVYFYAGDRDIARRAEAASLLISSKPILAAARGRRAPPRGTIELLLP